LLARVPVLVLVAGLLAPASLAGATQWEVSIAGFVFNPSTVNGADGDTVRWTNSDGAPHTASHRAFPAAFDTGTLNTGQSGTSPALAAGTYPYQCNIHPSMQGVVQLGPNTAPGLIVDVAEGATVSGTFPLTGTAPDGEGPHTYVLIRVDGQTPLVGGLGLQTDAPGYAYSFPWNTLTLLNGVHNVTFEATDGALNSTIIRRNITVSNAPTVDLAVVQFSAFTTGPLTRTLTATVRNLGNTASGAYQVTFTYEYQGAEHPIGTLNVTNTAPQANTPLSFPWDATGKLGTFTLRARADSGGAIPEPDEANNVRTAITNILVPGPPVDLFDPPI
jgi:plastocyanin